MSWGNRLIKYIDSKPTFPDGLQEEVDWIIPFRENIQEWMTMHKLVETALEVVLQNGYQKGTVREWRKRVADVECTSPLIKELYQGILLLLKTETCVIYAM